MTSLPGPAGPPRPPDARASQPPPAGRFSPLALGGWLLFGLLAALSVLGILTIGIYVAPVALLLLALLLIKAQPHARAGAAIGAGLLLLWVAWNLRWVSPDSCSGTSSAASAPGEVITSNPCAQFAIPWGWLAAAAVAFAIGAAFLRRDMRGAWRRR